MKKNRLDAIVEIITNNAVYTQDDLIDYLQKYGYNITQATVSRDIRQLNLVKLTDAEGRLRYALPKAAKKEAEPLRLSHVLALSIRKVEFVNNLIVVHTTPGMAQAIALEIDHMNRAEILGTVAGDDTILIVSTSAEAADTVSFELREMARAMASDSQRGTH